MKALIVGAGVTGCFTAARLMAKGVDVAVLARGDRATRLERDGLRLRDGLTGEETTVRLDVVRTPVRDEFEVAMVWIPTALGARRIASLLRSDFGRIALAAHASTARDEIGGFAADLLALAGPSAGAEMRALLGAV